MSTYESSARHPTSNTATRKARPSKKNQPSNAALDNTGPERGHARSHRSPEDVAKLHQLLNGYNSPDSETGSSEHEEDDEGVEEHKSVDPTPVPPTPTPTPPPTPQKPKRVVSEAQLANLARGREKANTSRREKASAARRLEMEVMCEAAASKAVAAYKKEQVVTPAPKAPRSKSKRAQLVPVQEDPEISRRPVQGKAKISRRPVQEDPEISQRPVQGKAKKPRRPVQESQAVEHEYMYNVGHHEHNSMFVPGPNIHPHLLTSAF